MNTHKKLLGLKFKTCQPHKMSRGGYQEPFRMIPDDSEIKNTYVNGKLEKLKIKKIHPKSERFYKLIYDKGLTIWIKISKDIIDDIWLEGESIEYGVQNIYSFRPNVNNQIMSKIDILKKLPKKVQRDFLLNDIFK